MTGTPLSLLDYEPPPSDPLDALAKRVGGDPRRGRSCPTCGQRVQVYRRSIHHQMAAWLLDLIRAQRQGAEWVVATSLPARGGDYAKLAHWGLIEQRWHDGNPRRRTSGEWRPTQLGLDFAAQRASVPRHVLIYDAEVYGWSAQRVTISECLGEDFDYGDLIEGWPCRT